MLILCILLAITLVIVSHHLRAARGAVRSLRERHYRDNLAWERECRLLHGTLDRARAIAAHPDRPAPWWAQPAFQSLAHAPTPTHDAIEQALPMLAPSQHTH